MNLKTFWIHLKIIFMGHKDYMNKGYAMIPCRKCNKVFKSLPRYKRLGTYDIDTKCKECRGESKSQ